MKIIKVLVDEMPSGCKRCNFCVAKMYCSLLEDRKTTVPDEPYKRRADCPLVYDFGDRETNALNKRIAELEAAQRRWRVMANGELPELGKEVIFYDSIMERRLKGCLRKNGGVEWLSDEGYTFSSRDGRYSRITHWMPLPQPPEVQE